MNTLNIFLIVFCLFGALCGAVIGGSQRSFAAMLAGAWSGIGAGFFVVFAPYSLVVNPLLYPRNSWVGILTCTVIFFLTSRWIISSKGFSLKAGQCFLVLFGCLGIYFYLMWRMR